VFSVCVVRVFALGNPIQSTYVGWFSESRIINANASWACFSNKEKRKISEIYFTTFASTREFFSSLEMFMHVNVMNGAINSLSVVL
jgi:hypothetical protein